MLRPCGFLPQKNKTCIYINDYVIIPIESLGFSSCHVTLLHKVSLIFPILTGIVSAYFAIAPLFKRPIEFAICCLSILSAIPIHYLVIRCIPESVENRKEQAYSWILEHFPMAKCTEEKIPVETSADQ